jgi:hypothetical protein
VTNFEDTTPSPCPAQPAGTAVGAAMAGIAAGAASLLPELVAAVRGTSVRAADAALKALGTLLELERDGPGARLVATELARLGALDAAASLISNSSDVEVTRHACSLLSQLCIRHPANAAAAAAAGCLPVLARLVDDDREEIGSFAVLAVWGIVYTVQGEHGTSAHAEAAAAAGAFDAVARFLARHAGAGRVQGVVSALQTLRAGAFDNEERADRIAASGALSAAAALLRSPDAAVAQEALKAIQIITGPSHSRARALALDPAAAPALVGVLMAAPARARYDAPYVAAGVLGYMAEATVGRWRPGGAPNAVASEVRRAGGIPRLVALLRAALAGAMVEGTCAVLCCLAPCLVTDEAACPAALAAGAVPPIAGVFIDASAGPRRGAALAPELLELASRCLVALARAPHGRAALAAQPGLAAAAARVLALHPTSVVPGATATTIIATMLEGYDEAGAAAAEEVARAGGAPSLVRFSAGRPAAERRRALTHRSLSLARGR